MDQESFKELRTSMEGFDGLVRRLVRCFNGSGLNYAFTGALAVSFYGSPRTTSDVDVMVAVGGGGAVKAKVVEALRCVGLEVQERSLDDALESGYNIATFRDLVSPYTIDVILSLGELDRRSGRIGGLDTFLQEPEGLILSKLRMIKATLPRERAAKDEMDVRSVLAFTRVDLEAIRVRAEQDSTLEILEGLVS